MRFGRTLWILLLAGASARAQEDTVAFDLVRNIPVIRGSVNGQPAVLVVDTGANSSLLTPEAARAAGLKGGEGAVCRSIGAGDAVVTDHPVIVWDPPQARFLRKAGTDYSGILGTPFLSRFAVTLDYERKVVSFSAPSAPREGHGHRIPFELENGLIFVRARINGKGPARFVIDSGAATTVVTPEAARPLELEGRKYYDRDTELPLEWLVIPSIQVGPAEATAIEAVIFDPPQVEKLREMKIEYAGLLGYSFLAQFRVTVDYRSRTLILAPPGHAGREGLGLELAETTVRAVKPGSRAARAAFRRDDVIVAVNGQSVRYFEEIEAILGGAKPGSELVFRVLRDDQPVRITLKK